ncbi:MAG: PqqD family peptide modification chaperone [Candidatus Bathyarchaeota archaeon]|nr:MAG: PqqD family peptide modification chaperone [Candidatus Bathyarchaeota archaeon]
MKSLSEDQVLFPPGHLLLRKLGEFYIVLNADGPNVIVADESGREFFQLCDGTRRLGEIADQIHQKYPSEGTSLKNIKEFSGTLLAAGFVSTEPFHQLKKEAGPPEKLSQIYLHLTRQCNLNCKHCYINAGVPLQDEMKLKDILTLVEDFWKLGGYRLILTGGEAFLRRELLFQTASKARDLGIQDIKVETNGTLITDTDIPILKDLEVKVAVSLGGATPESHSYVRGEGTFHKVIKNVKRLVESNVDTTIGITLMRPNLEEGAKAVELAKELGVNLVTLNMVTMMGRAREHKEMGISPAEAMPTIKEIRKASAETGVKTIFEEVLTSLKNIGRRESCGAGVDSLSIASNGDIYPCNSFQGGPLKAGNIRQQSLEEIWKNSEVCQTFQNLSVLDIPECKRCELKFICSGGCLAETYRERENLRVKSPYCHVYKEIYWDLISELAHELWKEA